MSALPAPVGEPRPQRPAQGPRAPPARARPPSRRRRRPGARPRRPAAAVDDEGDPRARASRTAPSRWAAAGTSTPCARWAASSRSRRFRDLQVDGAAGPLPARLYTPARAGGRRPGPHDALPARRRVQLRRAALLRRRLSVPGRALRSAAAGRRLPARARSTPSRPLPRTPWRPTAGSSPTPARSTPTRPGSPWAATPPAATSPPWSPWTLPGRGSRWRSSCSSTR